MIEAKIDRYLRRNDTRLAAMLRKVSDTSGPEWGQSRLKRALELSLTLPAAIVTTPAVVALAAANKILYQNDPFFVQQRIRQEGEEVPVVKIRSMKPGAENNTKTSIENSAQYSASKDPRNTGLGRFMRRFNLEELPQFWQIVNGQWSLIGIRSAPQYVFDHIKGARPNSYESWRAAYFSQKPGTFSLNSALNPNHKNDSTRTHYDIFQSKKASLGLDLYILYKHAVKGLNKLPEVKSTVAKNTLQVVQSLRNPQAA